MSEADNKSNEAGASFPSGVEGEITPHILKIENALHKTARRRKTARGLNAMWQSLPWSAAFWLLALAVYKAAPIPPETIYITGGISLIIPVIAFFWGFSRPTTLLDTAQWVDSKQNLKERLSTALELAQSKTEGPWKQLVISDAARAVDQLNDKALLPYTLPRSVRWSVLLLVCAAGLGFVPEYRTEAYVQKKNEEKIIKETGRELAELTRRTLDKKPPVMEQTKKSLETISELGDHLSKAQLTRSEALKDLASATEKLKEQAKELTKSNPGLKTLEKAARSAAKGGSQAADLQKQIDNLSKQMAASSANPEALEKFKDALDKAKEMAANLPKQQDSPEAKEAEEKMQAALADLAKQAKELGLDLPSLSEAMAALAESQPDQVLKDLQVAEIELEKVQAMAKALEKMQLQAQKLGKDLAEQLKNGQAEAAQANLQKMAQQLEKGDLNAAAIEKMMEELAGAQGAASEYGKVGELLKDAAQKMKEGDKGEAAKSLQAAARELGTMMQQMGDAQSLLAPLESLQQAQMAIANGQGWNNDSRGRPGAGRSGAQTTQGGVGTWTDEDSWQYPEVVDRWDNSGVVRPDTDGKGVSDRGDGQLADNLLPTKVKGQITPGGPMPSVTLKGVSIKGTSKVQFQEMLSAAQSDAQGALNQDQVPKAYQGAVRDYFDDLKQ
ncbi:MAG: hypothetical protein ACO1QB_09160 [Verrucomicrobiales bacterium]